MGQVLVVGFVAAWIVGAVKTVIDIVDTIQRSRITNNPVLTAIETAEDAEQYVRKVLDDATSKGAADAAEQIEAAEKAQREAEERLHQGIQPIVLPTPEEVEEAKARTQYQDGLFHFAIAGVAGSGKSSLINALRGLSNKETAAAKAGVVETTCELGRYPDPNPRLPFVWYDIPGAGTLRQPDWLYFNKQGLFVFDCIIVLFDNRFTQTDAAILANCQRFQIPTYIVRSKADVHIANVMRDVMGYESEDDEDRSQFKQLYDAAQKQFTVDTRETVRRNLTDADLPEQRVYIVSNKTLFSTVKKLTTPKTTIDEVELMKDLLGEACARRCIPREDME